MRCVGLRPRSSHFYNIANPQLARMRHRDSNDAAANRIGEANMPSSLIPIRHRMISFDDDHTGMEPLVGYRSGRRITYE